MYMIVIDADKCEGCEECVTNCPNDCFVMESEKSVLTGEECEFCESCLDVCATDAITITEM